MNKVIKKAGELHNKLYDVALQIHTVHITAGWKQTEHERRIGHPGRFTIKTRWRDRGYENSLSVVHIMQVPHERIINGVIHDITNMKLEVLLNETSAE